MDDGMTDHELKFWHKGWAAGYLKAQSEHAEKNERLWGAVARQLLDDGPFTRAAERSTTGEMK